MLVVRSRLAAVERERDEWRRRAETVPTRRTEYVVRRPPIWVRLLGASWFVTIGLLVGGAALPRANDTPIIREDYAGCIGRARYEAVTDQEVVEAFQLLSRVEGIIPALEPAHAIAWLVREHASLAGKTVLVNLSGRGDKDVAQMMDVLADRPVQGARN